MGANLRRTWIAAIARLRQAGVGPWIVFLGWGVFCTAQEAAVLRTSGILLREPAMWVGAAALWVIFVIPQIRRAAAGVGFATNTLLLLVVTGATVGCLELANLIAGGIASGPGPVTSAAWFLMALVPVSLALAVAARVDPETTAQSIIDKMLVFLSAGPAAVVVTAAWSAVEVSSLVAATGLSICASLVRMIAPSGEPRPWAPTRKHT
ncbi:MAG: hypothetical protein JNM25_01750 [Planctomycetes bacterium]|nr:hypothetical protein [Planctomycetota bacterium]